MEKLQMTDSQIENFIKTLLEIYSNQIGVSISLKKKGS